MPTPNKKRKFKKKKTWTWENEQNQAIETLKEDALCAVLYQEQEGMRSVISYASRGLNKAEKNYPSHKREFIPLKLSICYKFKDYLDGQRFTVLTDNSPVTYVLTTSKLDATGHRWLAALSTFNFENKYRSGKNNADADAFQRYMTQNDVQLPSNPSKPFATP